MPIQLLNCGLLIFLSFAFTGHVNAISIGVFQQKCIDKTLCHKTVNGAPVNYPFCCEEDDPSNRGEFSDKQICCDRACDSSWKKCVESIGDRDSDDSGINIWIIMGIVLGIGVLSLAYGGFIVWLRARRRRELRNLVMQAFVTSAVERMQQAVDSNLHRGYDQPPPYETQVESSTATSRGAETTTGSDYSPFITQFVNDMNRNRGNNSSSLPAITATNQEEPPPSYEEATSQS